MTQQQPANEPDNKPVTADNDLPDEDSEATVIVPASQQARYFAAAVAATPGHASTTPAAPTASAPSAAPTLPPSISPRKEPGTEPRTGTLPGSTVHHGDLTTRQVGRYEVRDCLGRGGMATVYRAHDPDIGRDVAIKFLHASLCEDADCRERFVREAKAAGGLSHPNIVIVHDVGEIEHRPYMAMELLDGASLADVLSEGKPLPIRDTVVMGIQLARALDYAHQHGIVHRDIKPGNIVRLKDGNTIKVTDFGIAHVESTKGEQHTRSGEVLGTPQYMSPEQTVGGRIDGRSDLFSAGVVLYQMLTGQRPFQGDSMVAIALKIAKEQPTPLDKLRADVPAALRRVVDRCMVKEPDSRYQSGKELADALVKVLNEIDEAALARNRPRIIPLRVKWALTMAVIVALVMGLTATVTTRRQYAAMMDQVADNGAALSRFIAAQNAVAALSEDWVAVDVTLQEIMKTKDFDSVTVIDRGGIVRAASQAALVGQAYRAPQGEALPERSGGIKTWRAVNTDSQHGTVLGFEAPITFAGKNVGRVVLGLPEAPLTHVARLSMSLMAVLVLVTVLAVALAMYFVANWFARPIKLVAESMAQIAKGRFDHRIHEHRKDEFGELYVAFDQMAQALQDRASGAGATTPPTQKLAA
ncbi:MAG TPA: protein kinase [Aquabacterium sp.]|uniref:protein kinase domain-containing protein n=1 Tax=Aquabacterium sp. TaxID=1872578 RepID=UPI002E31EE29|nr:protein kinase [Aquabacterium sp.]HEX5355991.1 protein kinase [Aquabacterium sp.]